MSKRNDYSEEDFDFRRIQKSSNKRKRKSDRHKTRESLNDIIRQVNENNNLESLEDEWEEDYE
jgi:hypothetical protein